MKRKLTQKVAVLALLFFSVSFMYAQKTVTGTVSDESGPLPGVTVVVKGTQTNASTDFDGNYSIEVSEGSVLTFSYIGMSTKEVTIGSANTYNVTLVSDNALEEVVVTAFGIKRQKRSLGYATTTISNDEITEITTSNPFESLSGKIAGVDITAPNQQGASTKVVIRGLSTLGSNAPLYVVDGSPINNSSTSGNSSGNNSYDAGTAINDLDPNNIASMTVLKGAAAAALYGSRASNGAIIITTKSGKQGSTKVEISSSYDILEVARVPKLQQQFGHGWAGLDHSSAVGGGLGTTNENGSWGPAYNGEVRLWGQEVNGAQQYKANVPLENNVRDFYDLGYIFTNSARISGGGDKYLFSLGFTDSKSDGVIPTAADTYKKRVYSLSASLREEKFTVTAKANLVVKNQNAVSAGQGSSDFGNSTMQELLQIPVSVSIVDLEDQNNIYNTNSYYYTPYSANPYWSIKNNGNKIKTNRFYGNVNLSYNLAPGLTASLQVAGDISNRNIKSYGAKVEYIEGSSQDYFSANGVTGGVSQLVSQNIEYDTFLNLSYNKSITEDLVLDANLGFNYNEWQYSSLSVSVTDLDVDNYYEITNSGVTPSVGQSDYLKRETGVFGVLSLAYQDKIFLNLTGRNDMSSTLLAPKNSYFYPSASLSYIAIDNGETFLKVRTALAKVGKGAAAYQTSSTMIQGFNSGSFGSIQFPINGINSFELSSLIGNADIEPEFTTEFEIGAEFSMFNKRLIVDASVYNKDSKGVITSRPLPRSTGYSSITGNFLDLNNKGIELLISAVPVQTENFTWNVDYTFTKNKNEVTGVVDGLDEIYLNGGYGISMYAVKGEAIGVFKMRKAAKTDSGQYIVDASTGFYTQEDEESIIGGSQRDFVMGLKNTFKYKGFKLGFSLDWKQGGEMYSYTSRLTKFVGSSLYTAYNDRNTFIVPNSVVDVTDYVATPDADATYVENTTAVSFDNITSFYGSSNPAIEESDLIDKTFVRLRDVSLSYSLPTATINKLKLDRVTLGVYGRNLFLWTPDENPYVDPEVSTYGTGVSSDFGEFAGNPAQRTYGVSLKIKF